MDEAKPFTSTTASTRSVISVVLGILSLICCCCGFFAGIPAIVLGRCEIKDIAEGKVDPTNLATAKTGMILGIIGTVISLIITTLFIIIASALSSADNF